MSFRKSLRNSGSSDSGKNLTQDHTPVPLPPLSHWAPLNTLLPSLCPRTGAPVRNQSVLGQGPLCSVFWPQAWLWRCREVGRSLTPTSGPSSLWQWPVGRLWTAPRSQLTTRRSTARPAMGESTVPRGSGLDKAPAASALTQANTWASSSKSE